jgi:hypothetical protein
MSALDYKLRFNKMTKLNAKMVKTELKHYGANARDLAMIHYASISIAAKDDLILNEKPVGYVSKNFLKDYEYQDRIAKVMKRIGLYMMVTIYDAEDNSNELRFLAKTPKGHILLSDFDISDLIADTKDRGLAPIDLEIERTLHGLALLRFSEQIQSLKATGSFDYNTGLLDAVFKKYEDKAETADADNELIEVRAVGVNSENQASNVIDVISEVWNQPEQTVQVSLPEVEDKSPEIIL